MLVMYKIKKNLPNAEKVISDNSMSYIRQEESAFYEYKISTRLWLFCMCKDRVVEATNAKGIQNGTI